MRTYVIEHVLTDYTDGLIVIKAKNKSEAVRMILDEFPHYCFAADGNNWEESNFEYLQKNIRELKNNEIVHVYGGS